MKFFITMMTSLILTFSANAIIVEKVTQNSYILADCPYCMGGQEVTTTQIQFSDVSCLDYTGSYKIKVEDKERGFYSDSEKFITIVNTRNVDCFGPTRKRSYSISTEELQAGERYILGNPSVLK